MFGWLFGQPLDVDQKARVQRHNNEYWCWVAESNAKQAPMARTHEVRNDGVVDAEWEDVADKPLLPAPKA